MNNAAMQRARSADAGVPERVGAGMNAVKHWPQKSLSLCLELIIDYRGKSIPKSDQGIQLITARNVRDGIVDLRHQEFIPVDLYDSWMDRGIPQAGDVLFTTEAPLGMIAPYPLAGTFALGQRLVALRANEIDLHSGYLLQFLRSPIGQNRIFTLATGSTAIGIRQSELRKIKIPLPPLAEQRKIAAILGTWDAAIDRAERLVAALKARKKALMQRLLTGEVRFPGFEGEWENVELRDIGNFINGRAFKPEDWGLIGLPIIRIQNLTGTNKNMNFFAGDVEDKYIVEPEDILVSWSASLGVYVWKESKAILNQHIFKAVPKNNVDKSFFYYALSNSLEQMKKRVHGSTMQHITKEPFLSTKIMLPHLSEQKKIAAVLTNCDSQIASRERECAMLQLQKRGLMQRLLTGEVRVAGDG